MKIYLDACCVNRLTDEQSQVRIRQEAEAIERILGIVREGKYSWLSSDVLAEEIENSPQIERRNANRGLLALSSELILVDHYILDRAHELQAIGYGAFDAMHLASAEAGHADVLLTTDDRFLKRASRGHGDPQVSVRNPISWLRDVSI
jgi:hypothetical protein